jgi:hypothetical protein
MTTLILAEITATEWAVGVIATVLGGIILTAIIAVAAHISNSGKHPASDAIVFKDVCEAEMKGQRDCVEIEIKNMKVAVEKLEGTIAAGFVAVTNQISKLKP